MLTEIEAQGKWCPMSRMLGLQQSFNRVPGQYEAPHGCGCIASLCAAWRWVSEPYEYVTMDNREPDMAKKGWLKASDGPPPAPAGDGWESMHEPKQKDGYAQGVLEQTWRRPRTNRTGFCGLAIR